MARRMYATHYMQCLTFAGALPFILATGIIVSDPSYTLPIIGDIRAFAIKAQIAYGAIILSFLGGIHWGLAVTRKHSESLAIRHAFYSNFISLSAWVALLLNAAHHTLLLMICLYSLTAFTDIALSKHRIFPLWFGRLRLYISIIVILCLAVSAANL